MRRHSLPTLVAAALVLLTVRAAGAIDLTACGTVPQGQTGVLLNDVDCSGGAMVVETRGTLDLNGFVLTGNVGCEGRCTVTSSAAPGMVLAGGIGLHGGRVENLTVDCDGSPIGILVNRGVRVRNVTITDCATSGIHYGSKPANVRAENLVVTGNDAGIELNAGVLKGVGVILSGNTTYGAGARVVVGEGFIATGNGTVGVGAAKRAALDGATITGNGTGVFVTFGSARLRASDVSGNAVDVATARRPSLDDTTCGTSRVIVDAVVQPDSWQVCPGE